MNIQQQLLEIPENFEQVGVLLRSSPKSITKKMKINLLGEEGSVDLVVKAYYFPQLLRRRFRRRRGAKHSKNITMRLIERGFSTPEPIACLEFHKSHGFYQSYYACKFWETNFDPYPLLRMNKTEGINYKDFLRVLTQNLARQHQCGIFHYDLNPGNILVNENRGSFNIAIIDFEQCRILKFLSEKKKLQALINLTPFNQLIHFIGLEYATYMGMDPVSFINKLEIAHRKRWLHLSINH